MKRLKARPLIRLLILLVLAVGLTLWWMSRTDPGVEPGALSSIQGDASQGETVFAVGGCLSCHAQLESEQISTEDDAIILSGGRRLETPFGTFIVPNISSHPDKGIGRWTMTEFANAMLHGVSPDGSHYYPAFPYASYTRMSLQDVVDLKTYLDTLVSYDRSNEPHQLPFPFSVRRGLGLWKRLYLDQAPVVVLDDPGQVLLRGRYLVEGPGHCAECHTPRNILGGFDKTLWLAGAPNPDGDGSTPNITPHKTGIKEWDTVDIAEYLSSGFTPEYDVAGSSMSEVIDNTAQLSEEDRTAIAVYLQSVPAIEKSGKME